MSERMALNGWYKLRWKILDRDKYTCQYCGQSAPDVKLEVDHRVSLADGGTNDESNLVTSCWSCNRGKSGLRQSIVLRRNKDKLGALRSTPWRQNKLLELVGSNPMGLAPKQMAEMLDITCDNVRTILSRLNRKGKIKKERTVWVLPPSA